jgi:hypothetical protein
MLLLAPVCGALLFSCVRLILERDDVPELADYQAVRVALDEEHHFARAHDALAVLPPWSLRPLEAVGALDPISGDALFARPLHRHQRLFVLVEPDGEDDLDAFVAKHGPPAGRQQLGRVALLRFELREAPVVFDFAARIEDAEVSLVRGDDVVACDVPLARGFACRGQKEWLRVQRQWLLVSENGDEALWTPPPPRGQRIDVRFRHVPLGRALVVRAGHTRDGADRARAPARITISIDGARRTTLERAPAFAFTTNTVELPALEGTHTVTFSIDTDDDTQSAFAWDAYTIGTAP